MNEEKLTQVDSILLPCRIDIVSHVEDSVDFLIPFFSGKTVLTTNIHWRPAVYQEGLVILPS